MQNWSLWQDLRYIWWVRRYSGMAMHEVDTNFVFSVWARVTEFLERKEAGRYVDGRM